MNISPPYIKELDANEVLVFGSNEAGIHGAGLAKKARKFGAVLGQGVGMQGKTYAIPTKDMNIKTLPIDKIKPYVDDFIEFANNNLQYKFLVTKLGCGLAGYTAKDIAPLFAEAIDKPNIWLPTEFIDELISTGMYNQIMNVEDTEPDWNKLADIGIDEFEEYLRKKFEENLKAFDEEQLKRKEHG